MATQEPSPGCALRSNSTLKPSSTVNASAAVATLPPPVGAAAAMFPHGSTPNLPSGLGATQFAPGLKSFVFQPSSAVVLVFQLVSVTILVRVAFSVAEFKWASNTA